MDVDEQAEQGGACEVEFYEYEPEVQYAEFVAIGPMERARRSRARRYAEAIKSRPALMTIGVLALAGLAGGVWMAWQRQPQRRSRRQFEGERLGPLWDATPQESVRAAESPATDAHGMASARAEPATT